MWEQALLAKTAAHPTPCQQAHRHREQARSHRGSGANSGHVAGRNPMWERACSRWRQHIQHQCPQTHRYHEQARLPQGIWGELRSCSQTAIQCGSEPCSRWRQHIRPPCQQTHRYREQARSHRGSAANSGHVARPQSNVGASLLAMAAAHPAPMPTDLPFSLPSQSTSIPESNYLHPSALKDRPPCPTSRPSKPNA